MDVAPVNFYNIFCARVLFSYICQSVVPGTASLVRGEKGRALLIQKINVKASLLSYATQLFIYANQRVLLRSFFTSWPMENASPRNAPIL